MADSVLSTPDFEPNEGQISRFELDNGLTVLMMKTGKAPVAAVDIWYKVGSKNEEQGRSGFAHLFEHMMFQGSENVAKSEHMNLISEVGGWTNGSTSKDRTNYFQVVPANQLRLALWLEADRMRSLAITPENFQNQLDTVKEERRMRVDNAPYAAIFYEKLDELVYENWAYKHSVIGSMADLDRAPLEEIARFHEKYYRPNNAILAVTGKINIQDTLSLVKDYFGDIPAGEAPPAVDLSEPRQTGEKRMRWDDKFAPLPAYVCAYHIPGRNHPDYYVMELLEKILFDGESSRMYQRLVEKDQKLLHLYGGTDSKMGPGTLYVFGQIKPGGTHGEIESIIEEEFERLRQERVLPSELEKAMNQLKVEFVSKLEKAYHIADLLCYYTMMFDDPSMIKTELDRYLNLTADDLMRVARQYFVKDNRSTIEVYPAANGQAAEKG